MTLRRRFLTVLAAVVASLACTAVLAAPASANRWNFETLDGHRNGPNGELARDLGQDNTAVVWGGTPHVFYTSRPSPEVGDDLRHAWWTGTRWQFETLDGEGGANSRTTNSVGLQSSVVVWNNEPHVFYNDATGGNLRHAWWNGSAWFFETLDGAGGTNGRTDSTTGEFTTATVWNGTPHVWYHDDDGGNLRHAWWTGSAWFFETLDGHRTGPNGEVDRTLANYITTTVWNNEPHIFYWDYQNDDLRHAWWNGRAWFFETLDGHRTGPNGEVFRQVGAYGTATVWNNQPHIWYSDDQNGDMRHAWWTGTRWQFETLDGAGGTNGRVNAEVGRDNVVTVWGGTPHVWYRDVSSTDLRHAWWTGSAWFFETLDGNSTAGGRVDGDVGSSNAVTVWNNEPHVFTFDNSGRDLRHAWYG